MNWPFWSEVFLRSAALLLAGEALRRFSRKQSAAFRHALLLATMGLLSLLPLLCLLCPAIHFSLPSPVHTSKAIVTVRELSSTAGALPPQPAFNWLLALWLFGSLCAAGPLLAGALAASKLFRSAVPMAGALPVGMPRGVSVLLSSHLSIPLTCGVRRPRILLPAAASTWTPLRLRAVLLHELAHIRRRDVAAQMAVHLVTALWWFQPLAWLVRRGMRTESELACDAEALAHGLRPSEYGAELLAVARAIEHRPLAVSSCGIAMASPSAFERRLCAILNPVSHSLSRPKLYFVALSLGAAAITASALDFHTQPGGSLMKRTLLSGLLTSAGLSAATISGTIHDPRGAAVADANVSVSNPDTGFRQEVATDMSGHFAVSGDTAGQYILRIEKPGFASLFREFDLKAEATTDRQFTMNEGGEAVADRVVTSSEPAGRRVRVGGQVAQSNLTTKVQPVYPLAAKDARVQGEVEIETSISKDGVPVELRVISSPSDDLSESALEAVRQWRYRPTLLNGEPVAIVTDVLVNYTLSQ